MIGIFNRRHSYTRVYSAKYCSSQNAAVNFKQEIIHSLGQKTQFQIRFIMRQSIFRTFENSLERELIKDREKSCLGKFCHHEQQSAYCPKALAASKPSSHTISQWCVLLWSRMLGILLGMVGKSIIMLSAMVTTAQHMMYRVGRLYRNKIAYKLSTNELGSKPAIYWLSPECKWKQIDMCI